MKTFSQIRESIIDIPRSTYAPGVFDDEDTNNPKIKDSVLRIINDTIEKEYAPFADVKRVALIGSIITKRYRADADLDLDIFMELNDSSEEMRRKLVSKTMGELNGKLIPGTKHPINYYVQVNKKVSDEHIEEADGIFDVRENKFIKRPKEFKFDVNTYLKDFQKQVDKIDILKGELKRDIIDYDELIDLKTGEIKDLEKRVKGKLDEIEESLQSLSDIGSKVDSDRKSAFLDDMTPDEIKTFSIKNRLPKNVVYKMLEKYHYTTFLKKCKMILDDGKVTDAEIDSLRKEDSTQSKARVFGEALDKANKLIFAFGRFNPPTIGHAKLMKEVITQARKNNAKHIVYASASTDKRKNPLDVNTKVKFMKKMFPDNNIKAAGGTQRTFMEILKFFNKMYGEVIMIAGSDRISEFQGLADKYNGKDYEYKKITVVSSGERDPDAEGVTGISASKMREMAKKDDYRNFKLGVPNLSSTDSKALFTAVKKGMGINESIESFTNFINNDLREEYHQERIFNIGDIIEHMDGTAGMIVRRGSNYVSYETNGLIKKAWLYDIQMKENVKDMNKENLLDRLEKEMEVDESIDKQYEIGTDEYTQHTMKMTPGQPIQNFRKHSSIITTKDIENFKNEGGIIDKYKKRFKENWKVELDKAVERMKEQL